MKVPVFLFWFFEGEGACSCLEKQAYFSVPRTSKRTSYYLRGETYYENSSFRLTS